MNKKTKLPDKNKNGWDLLCKLDGTSSSCITLWWFSYSCVMFYFVVSVWRFLTTPDGNTCPVEYLYPAPEIRFCIEEGDEVVITELLFAAQYNGERGVICSTKCANTNGRYKVRLDATSKVLSVKVSNIRLRLSSMEPCANLRPVAVSNIPFV